MAKFEEFSKPQSNEVRAHFDLLNSFPQGNRNIDEWYNAVQAQINLAKYPLETAKILHRDIFWFFMKDKEFVCKTINEGNVNIRNFCQQGLTIGQENGELKSHYQTHQTACR